MTQNKKIIGITGNSGSGKSTVARILEENGVYVLDADKLAHKAMEPGEEAYNEIVAEFGAEILSDSNTDNIIDRKKLGRLVFSDKSKRTRLEEILHPRVIATIKAKIAESDFSLIAIDAVLLIESGLHRSCNFVWLIIASEESRLSRIIARDSLSPEAAAARMRNQRDPQTLAESAHTIINNDGDIHTLQIQTKQALERSIL